MFCRFLVININTYRLELFFYAHFSAKQSPLPTPPPKKKTKQKNKNKKKNKKQTNKITTTKKQKTRTKNNNNNKQQKKKKNKQVSEIVTGYVSCIIHTLFMFRHPAIDVIFALTGATILTCVSVTVRQNTDKQLTVQIYRLDTATGLFGYQTKRYPVVPDNLSEKKVVKVIGDKVTVQQQHSDNTPATKNPKWLSSAVSSQSARGISSTARKPEFHPKPVNRENLFKNVALQILNFITES